jgi:hypothetical protein
MTGRPKTEVLRRILKTGADFEKFVEQAGRPKFAIRLGEGADVVTDLCEDEWLFSDDVDCLMRALFGWEARSIDLLYQEPESDDMDGYWEVVGLPDYFNDVAASIAIRDHESDRARDLARHAFFNVVMNDAYSYGFFALENDSYASYIQDWKEDDDRKARPEHYRASKSFGIVRETYGSGIGNAPMQYLVDIGVASGRLSEEQLQAAGLTYADLIGKTCVVNGLGEVECIGLAAIDWAPRSSSRK